MSGVNDFGSTDPMPAFEALCRRAVTCRACFSGLPLEPALVDLAQPRWIGPAYWTSLRRIAVVLVNPASGKDHGPNSTLRDLLWKFRAGEIGLDEILTFQRLDMPSWSGGKFASYFIGKLGLDINEVAFANIAWCAENRNHYPMGMLSACFERHTSELLKIIDPHVVLLCGEDAQSFTKAISHCVPHARVVPAPHYAARYRLSELDQMLAEVRSELSSLGINHSSHAKGGVGKVDQSAPETVASRPRDIAVERAAEIARQLGMHNTTSVASGRYLKQRTATPNIGVIVFHRYGRDCVGVEGVRQGREVVLQRKNDWVEIGLTAHQTSPDSHKSAATFIIERPTGSGGSLDAEIQTMYRQLIDFLGREEI